VRGRKGAGKAAPPVHGERRARPGREWTDAALGVDLGGTKIALGVVGRTGEVLESERIPTRAQRPAAEVIDDIVDAIEQRWTERLPGSRPLGIGVAGQVDRDGTVLFGPNLDWHDVPLRARLARALHRPVAVLNDVQAATYGEWRHGAGRGTDDLVCLFVGTGVGGGIVADGRLRHGATGTAGELGHITVERNGRRCRCPNSGCLEAYAGGWAIAERAQEAVAADRRRGERLVAIAGDIAGITSETVEAAYRVGDPLARELVEETTAYLVAGLVSIVNAIDPAAIVLGGGVLAGYPSLVNVLEREVRPRALPAAVEGLRIVPAALGAESGLVGAATFARDLGPG
jgi:glucokinase